MLPITPLSVSTFGSLLSQATPPDTSVGSDPFGAVYASAGSLSGSESIASTAISASSSSSILNSSNSVTPFALGGLDAPSLNGTDLSRASQGATTAPPLDAGGFSTAPFASFFSEAIGQVDQLEKQAKSSVEGLISGKGVDVHEAMIATEKARNGI